MSRVNQTIQTTSENATADVAALFSQNLRQGDVILLHGTLGMGKTVFSRALIRGLCGSDKIEVPSPTFTLVQMYESPKAVIWHYDLYRLANEDEIYEIGWEEALSDGIIIVEWPERLGHLKPEKVIHVTLSDDASDVNIRKIEITYDE